MLFGRKPRGDRGVLLVPMLPGSVPRMAEPVEERTPASQRVLPVAAGLGGGLALIAAAVVLFAGGSGTPRAVAPVPSPATTVSGPLEVGVHPPLGPPKPMVPPHVAAAQRAGTAAARLAARLPVSVESTALLRIGSTLYAVGGATRAGTPSDGIWQVDLRTGRVSSAGRFIEPLTGAAAASQAGVLYLAGGWTGEKLATGVLRWSPGHSSSLVTRLPVGLRDAHAAFVGGTLYVVSADGHGAFAVDIATGSVTPVTKVPKALESRTSNLAALTAAVSATGSKGT
jgi:hypothetical protein